MKLLWKRDLELLEVEGKIFNVTCAVRNEIDSKEVRRLHEPKEVVRAIENGRYTVPYMPRKFPLGEFKVTGLDWIPWENISQRDFWPVKIKTNATQEVDAWSLSANGGYDKPSGKRIIDSGYHLHFCQNSRTTLGCGRVGKDTPEQVTELAYLIEDAIEAKEEVSLVVV